MTHNQSSSYRHIQVIVNPAAGKDGPALHTINQVLTEHDAKWDVVITQGEGDAHAAAARAGTDGFDLVAVYGGDGTVMEAANALHQSVDNSAAQGNTAVPLAILPGGTANVLAAELNVPNNLEAAMRLIFDPEASLRPVDMGRRDEQLFFHLSAGIVAEMVSEADRAAKNQHGLLAYIAAGLGQLTAMPEARSFELVLDGKQVQAEGLGVMITNFSRIGLGDLRLGHAIDVSDGQMDVMVIRALDLPTVIKTLTGVITTGAVSEALLHWPVQTVEINMDPALAIAIDGELLGQKASSLKAEVIPAAVRIITPASAEAQR